MVTSQPALWNTIAPVLDNVAVIAHEDDCAVIEEIDLHANQTVSVSWQMVQGDALAEVECSLVKGLPVTANCQWCWHGPMVTCTHRSSFM